MYIRTILAVNEGCGRIESLYILGEWRELLHVTLLPPSRRQPIAILGGGASTAQIDNDEELANW